MSVNRQLRITGTTSVTCRCGTCQPRPETAEARAARLTGQHRTAAQPPTARMTERQAADLLHSMAKEGTPVAQQAIALLARAFPKVAARVAADRASMPAPRAKSMVDAIRERAFGPAPRATASMPKPSMPRPLAAPADKPETLAPLRVPSMIERILSGAGKK